MAKEIIAELTKPWQRDEIKWRVSALNKDKTKTIPLAYVDARVVMDRLDRIMGARNWQDRYEFHGSRTLCYLSLRFDDEWLCKSDGAGDSDIEGEKGGISDAFKRAAVKWGMGRELYELKCKWMPIDEYKQLKGDPWAYLIKPTEQPLEPEPKKLEVSPEQKKHDWFVAKIATIKTWESFEEFKNSQKNKDARDALYAANKALSKNVEDAIEAKRLLFAREAA